MTIEELKSKLSDSTYCGDKLLVFKCSENNFVADQYINKISELRNLPIVYVEDLAYLLETPEDIFALSESSPCLSVYKCDELGFNNDGVNQLTNTIIVTHSITKEVVPIYSGCVIEIPKLLDWQIKDYVYSKGLGIEADKLNWLQSACKNDIYKIHNELLSFEMFSKTERQYLFDDMFNEGMFSDISNNTIFNFTTALCNRDIEALKSLYIQKNSLDISDMAFLMLVCQSFRNLILAHLNPSPTTENTGLTDKQIYAIRKTPLRYTKEEIYKIFRKITDIDNKIKSGDFPMSILFDYLIASVLGV